LVVALLITPPATAFMLTRRMDVLLGLAIGFGLIATWTGLYAAYYLSLPLGATIVAAATAQFAAVFGVQRLRSVLSARRHASGGARDGPRS
ncbi:MAG TPA: metal ABC transporter permease, partial [Limnochordia bacterium]